MLTATRGDRLAWSFPLTLPAGDAVEVFAALVPEGTQPTADDVRPVEQVGIDWTVEVGRWLDVGPHALWLVVFRGADEYGGVSRECAALPVADVWLD